MTWMCFFFSHSLVGLAIWFRSMSYWKTHPWPTFSVLGEGKRFVFKILLYMVPSISLSIVWSHPLYIIIMISINKIFQIKIQFDTKFSGAVLSQTHILVTIRYSQYMLNVTHERNASRDPQIYSGMVKISWWNKSKNQKNKLKQIFF